jgi:HEPN domain-containing protein
MADERSLTRLGESVADLEQASKDRLEDSEQLLKAGRYAAAIMHGLYALEIALKVLICRRLDVSNLPRVFETHNLEALMLHAGLAEKIRKVKRPRDVTQDWYDLRVLAADLERLRYTPDPARWNRLAAERLLRHLRDPPHGVLLWLRRQASIKSP